MNYINFIKRLKLAHIFCLSFSVVCGGFLFYKLITTGIGLELLYISPFFILFSVLFIFYKGDIFNSAFQYYVHKMLVWFVVHSMVFLGVYIFQYLRDFSPNVMICEYMDDDRMTLYLRENKTYKIEQHDIMTSWQDYGNYRIDGNKIYLSKEINFRMQPIKNPLYIRYDGIHFEYYQKGDKLHGGGAVMQITYEQ